MKYFLKKRNVSRIHFPEKLRFGTLILFLLACSFASVYAKEERKNHKALGVNEKLVINQTHSVSGKIIDENGEPLIGVSVREVGTTNGVTSNFDGVYTLAVKDRYATLEFSYIGYETQTVKVDGKTEMDVQMGSTAFGLDEVIVVAYGTQRKSSVTGSISTLKSENITNVTSSTVSSMLQGKIAGVSVGQDSGEPGKGSTITIRGRGSISSTTTPLWVVDGVVGGSTADLNPNDIETLTVLKDGSATALYGSRGANGVILVTTKTAKLGVAKIDISLKAGITNASQGKFKVMNSAELYKYTEAAFANSTGGTAYSWFTPALLENDTDWWDIATHTAVTQNYNVAYTSGTEKLRSFLSVDYYNEEGVVTGRGYQRFTARNNNTYKVNDRLNIKTFINGSYGIVDDKQRSIYSSLTYLPWDTPYNSLGQIKTGKEGTDISTGLPMSDYWFGRDASNYLYDNELNWSQNKTIGIDGSFNFDYKIIEGLTFESTNNAGFKYYIAESYTDPGSQGGSSTKGSINNTNDFYMNMYTNQMLRYLKTINGVHELNAFLGYEYTESFTKTSGAIGSGIPKGGEVLGVATTPYSVSGDKFTSKTIGVFFNANYTYDDRYSLQFSLRRDGSSKFGKNNRFGTFYTIGGGWNVHNESFIEAIDAINILKLRLSYGSTGNTPSAAFSHMGLYQINLNYNELPAAFPYQMANRNMSWEKAYTTNIGIDARLFDRLGLNLDLYNKNTSGLLYQQPLSALSGYSNVWINKGAMKNYGIEVTLSPEIIKTKDLKWSVDFNMSYNKNEITELADNKEFEISGNYIRETGYALGSYYMKEWAGVNPLDGTPLWFAVDDDGNKSLVGSEAQATLVRLDKVRYPDFTGGVNTHLSYKEFTLSAAFSYAAGFYIDHSGRQNYDNDGIEIQYNSMKLKDGWVRWEKPGDKASHPQVKSGGNNVSNAVSSRYLERGDFLKLKTVSLSYNLPSKLAGTIGMKSALASLSGENLVTFTGFSGIDPELGVNGEPIAAGGYSIPKRFSFSINLGF
jgi:TonB-linked SusC/RagA family outer membrane protein